MIAHRGYSSKYPDNTEPAFLGAVKNGSGGIETDIRITKDGVFAAIQEIGTTENVISGHVHTDNFVIKYNGVRLAFATKTGCVHPFRYPLNGGTVITIHADGHSDLRHEYVEIKDLLTPDQMK